MSQQAFLMTKVTGGRGERIPSPVAVFTIAWEHRRLIYSLAVREFWSRYKGSMLGGVWTFVTPLLLIGLYSVVFGGLFQSRWTVPAGANGVAPPFPVLLFAGMIWVNVFVECLSRSSTLMLENPAYIKKVVFPLEIMPYVALASALITAMTTLAVLAVCYAATVGMPPVTVLLLPVVVVPLLLMSVGVMWFFGSLGVYLRDLKQVIGLMATTMIFFSPQFYPLTVFDKWPVARAVVWLNPLTLILENVRKVMFWGTTPHWGQWLLYALIAWLVAWGGLVWYSKVHRGFADVV